MQELIAAAAAQIEGCQGAHPLDEQYFAIVFDAETYVLATPIEAQERLSLELPIGPVPPDHFAEVAKMLLSFNALNESGHSLRFAVLPDDGEESVTASLLADMSTHHIDANGLAAVLGDLAAQGQAWRGYLEAAAQAPDNARSPGDRMTNHIQRV
jgi:hypothetical protein